MEGIGNEHFGDSQSGGAEDPAGETGGPGAEGGKWPLEEIPGGQLVESTVGQ